MDDVAPQEEVDEDANTGRSRGGTKWQRFSKMILTRKSPIGAGDCRSPERR